MPSIAAALFDIDGTLIDSNDLHVEAWRQTGARGRPRRDPRPDRQAIYADVAAVLADYAGSPLSR